MCPLIACIIVIILCLLVPGSYMMGMARGVVIERTRGLIRPKNKGL